jgi:hypothetical protein
MIISYAYTTEALLAGKKTCTRSDWKDDYARRVREGQVHQAWDTDLAVGSHHLGEYISGGLSGCQGEYQVAADGTVSQVWYPP